MANIEDEIEKIKQEILDICIKYSKIDYEIETEIETDIEKRMSTVRTTIKPIIKNIEEC